MRKIILFSTIAGIVLSSVVYVAAENNTSLNSDRSVKEQNKKSAQLNRKDILLIATDAPPKQIPRKGAQTRHIANYQKVVESSGRAAINYLWKADKFEEHDLRRASDILHASRAYFPEEGNDYEHCESSLIYGYAYLNGREIYLCAYTLDKLGPQGISQILIHETMHLAGDADECSVTATEIYVMRKALGTEIIRNGYVDGCGL